MHRPLLAKILIAAAILVAEPSQAATFAVTKTADTDDGTCDADCSLREAIGAANALPGLDQVDIPIGTYTGSNFVLSDDLRLQGADRDTTILHGGFDLQTLHVDSGVAAEFFDLTFFRAGGDASAQTGSAIGNEGTVSVTRCTFRENFAREGGAINSSGSLTVTDSLFEDGYARVGGGAIRSTGSSLIVDQTTFRNNSTGQLDLLFDFQGHGGGIYATGGSFEIRDSLFEDNTAFVSGGAAYAGSSTGLIARSVFQDNFSGACDEILDCVGNGGGIETRVSDPLGVIRIEDSALIGNRALLNGGGLRHSGDGRVDVVNSTASGNQALSGAGISVAVAFTFPTNRRLTLQYSTVAFNQLDPNSAGPGLTAGVAAGNASLLGSLFEWTTIEGSVVAHNTDFALNPAANCITTTDPNAFLLAPTSLGGNVTDGGCDFFEPSDQIVASALLDSLESSGSTFTHEPLGGSPVIDAADLPSCPATDQAGTTRPIDGDANGTPICDSGAVEASPAVDKIPLPFWLPAILGVALLWSMFLRSTR